MRTALFAGALATAVTGAAFGGSIFGVVPSEYENTQGTASFIFFGSARGYQFLIHEDELTSFQGLKLTGLTWRLPMAATTDWPASDVIINNFDIYLSEGVAPADRTTTFLDNIVGPQTQVRSGPLTVPMGSYPATGTPRDWGLEIDFSSYTYTGGHLVIEVRHDGSSLSRSLDALSTSTSGYGTRYAAVWGGGYNTEGQFNANFVITRLTAVPAPGALALLGLGLAVGRRRRRA